MGKRGVKKSIKIATTIFIIPHYDDELGIFNQIVFHKQKGQMIVIIYLTSSDKLGQANSHREELSIKVLRELGLDESDKIYFLGRNLQVPDLKLADYIEPVYEECLNIVRSYKNVCRIYTTTYEGGHPDHDASHLITTAISKKLNLLKKAFQFPMYSGERLWLSFFRLFAPLSANGFVHSEEIEKSNRILFIKLFLSYFSQQPKTILGLCVPFIYHILFIKKQYFQKISVARVNTPPHGGLLLYERRGMGTYSDYYMKVSPFILKNLKS